MSHQRNDNLGFASLDDRDDFLKIRVDTLKLSAEIQAALAKAGVRNVGGLVRKTEEELRDIGLEPAGVDEIQRILKQSFAARDRLQEILVHSPTRREMPPRRPHIAEFRDALKSEDDIVGSLAKHFNVTKGDILELNRRKEIVEVRATIIYLLREYGGLSFPVIGRLLDRDHTTIIHSHRKMERLAKANAHFTSDYAAPIEILNTIKDRKFELAAKFEATKGLSGQGKLIEDILGDLGLSSADAPAAFRSKQISKRNMEILDLYRDGLTLENIGNVYKITRERVRQIVISTVRQMATNESLETGVVMDVDVLIDEEAKKRQTAQTARSEAKKKKAPPKEKRWSVYYPACRECGTTSTPHVKKGFCERCIGHLRGDRRESVIAKHGNKCDSCGRTRNEASILFGRDFYITKDEQVLCRGCFAHMTGTKLSGYKKFDWSRSYERCKKCETTTVPHAKGGLCENCVDFLTNDAREKVFAQHGFKCDHCGISRDAARSKYNRNLYVLKTGDVLCRGCFQINLAKTSGRKKGIVRQ